MATSNTIEFSDLRPFTKIYFVKLESDEIAAFDENMTFVTGVPQELYPEESEIPVAASLSDITEGIARIVPIASPFATRARKVEIKAVDEESDEEKEEEVRTKDIAAEMTTVVEVDLSTMATEEAIAAISRSMTTMGILDPRYVSTIGKKNIYTYRDLMVKMMIEAKLSMEAAKIVMQLTMSMKNYNRLMTHFAAKKSKEMMETFPEFMEAFKFLKEYCVATTSDAPTKMPVVKIPDSMPDIAAIVFVQSCSMLKYTKEKIVELLPKQMWAGSLALSAELQEVNKQAVKKEWDSWGITSGKKKNKAGEVLKFDEEIYANCANDQIPLINMEGVEFLDRPYTSVEINLFVDYYYNVSTNIISNTIAIK